MLREHKPPYKIGFYFVRDSYRWFDYNNASQVVLDLMQEKEIMWLSSDDHSKALPVFLGTHKDPDKCGVYLTLISDDDWQLLITKYISL